MMLFILLLLLMLLLQVRDGFTTCFMTNNTEHLESSILECFSEPGQYLLLLLLLLLLPR